MSAGSTVSLLEESHLNGHQEKVAGRRGQHTLSAAYEQADTVAFQTDKARYAHAGATTCPKNAERIAIPRPCEATRKWTYVLSICFCRQNHQQVAAINHPSKKITGPVIAQDRASSSR